ncbi:MAG: hypothetical protein FJ299_14615, partial [Planctomycetes bacterium]|nr:hypothetical protein [Planctomycetota bacterium]
MLRRLCWLALLAWLYAHALAQDPNAGFQSGARLAEYRERLAADRLRADDPAALAALVKDVQIELHGEPEHLREAVLELVALSALAIDIDARIEYATRHGRAPDPSENQWFAALRAAGEAGRTALVQLLGAPGTATDARVLALLAQACASGEEDRRLVAVELLAPQTEMPATLALFTCLRAPRARLRSAAAHALAGRADP